MDPKAKPAQVCDEISSELRDIATWLASGKLDPEQFRQAVLVLEHNKVTRHGFTLTGRNVPHGHTRFTLRCAASGNVCAEMEFDPATGAMVRHDMDIEEPVTRPRF